jgi:hypothetical protein
MSLTSFLKQSSDIRTALRQTFPLPRRQGTFPVSRNTRGELREEPLLACQGHYLGAVAGSQLLRDIVEVALDGSRTQV